MNGMKKKTKTNFFFSKKNVTKTKIMIIIILGGQDLKILSKIKHYDGRKE